MTRPLQIALIDDHQMFLDGLAEIIRTLDADYACTVFSTPSDALAAVDAGKAFDLIISDLVMAEMNGVAFLMALKARGVASPVLIISGIDTMPPIEKVLDAGASGFVSKAAPSKVLHRAIESALKGETFLTDDMWEVYAARGGKAPARSAGPPAAGGDLLGPRQVEVLRLIAEGCSNKHISEVLGISENTVKTHVRTIFRQLGVTRRTACLNKARSLGLVD